MGATKKMALGPADRSAAEEDFDAEAAAAAVAVPTLALPEAPDPEREADAAPDDPAAAPDGATPAEEAAPLKSCEMVPYDVGAVAGVVVRPESSRTVAVDW